MYDLDFISDRGTVHGHSELIRNISSLSPRAPRGHHPSGNLFKNTSFAGLTSLGYRFRTAGALSSENWQYHILLQNDKMSRFYYKMGNLIFYYKMGRPVLQNGHPRFITKWADFITKWSVYYKMGRFYYKMVRLLQNGTFITKWVPTNAPFIIDMQ